VGTKCPKELQAAHSGRGLEAYPSARGWESPGPHVLPEVSETMDEVSENSPDTCLAVGEGQAARHGGREGCYCRSRQRWITCADPSQEVRGGR
jgi:hypothetical protein